MNSLLNLYLKSLMSETSYTAVCDGGPKENDKHPIVYLDLTDGDVRCPYCNKLFKGVK